jgi:hypothetical protein
MLAIPALITQSQNATLLDGACPVTHEAFIKGIGEKSENNWICGVGFSPSLQQVDLESGVQKDTVRIERE